MFFRWKFIYIYIFAKWDEYNLLPKIYITKKYGIKKIKYKWVEQELKEENRGSTRWKNGLLCFSRWIKGL